MGKRAEAPRRAPTRDRTTPRRFDVDRAWLLRGLLVVVAVGLLLLIGKVSMMAFDGVGKRLDRNDPGASSVPAKPRDAS